MKIRVTLKDPDTMHDCVDRAYERLDTPPEGLADAEWDRIKEDRAAAAKSAISEKWMRYGEYLTVDFDVEAGTATVISTKESDD